MVRQSSSSIRTMLGLPKQPDPAMPWLIMWSSSQRQMPAGRGSNPQRFESRRRTDRMSYGKGPASPMGPTWRTGALYRTVDGGLSWKLIANNPGSTVVRTLGGNCGGYGIGDGVVFSSSVTGWLPLDGCASSDVLLVTHDGGVTWSAR